METDETLALGIYWVGGVVIGFWCWYSYFAHSKVNFAVCWTNFYLVVPYKIALIILLWRYNWL